MSRLIDADVLKQGVNVVSTHWLNEWSTLGVLSMVDKQPTVDAVPVVRCSECKHKGWIQEPCHGKSIDYCRQLERPVDERFFCGLGERKGGDK